MQALALIACEKFGATLAMCQETNKKMEDLIIKISGPKLVRFISAQIGYSADDCATQLSRSLAGVQFLGLAAALVPSVGTFEGADALSVMLLASASDKTLLPTARQLKDLLRVMEHRVNRSGFNDIWVGYGFLLRAHFEQRDDQSRGSSGPADIRTELMGAPGTVGISKLIEAFRELDRLGDVTAVRIRATSCAPWVMAFTRWCLGIPPSTYLPDGKLLLDQPASRVNLLTSNDANFLDFEITVQRSIGSPADLLRSKVPLRVPFGMITVECFGRIMCQGMGLETSDVYRAVCQALPYALKQICNLLRLSGQAHTWPLEPQTDTIIDESLMNNYAKAFPEDSKISNTLTRVLNAESQQDLQCLSEGQLVSDLPLVQLYLCSLAQTCDCKGCQSTDQTHPSDPERNSCKKINFWYQIAIYAADILALSVFENPETLLLSIRGSDSRAIGPLEKAIGTVLSSGKPVECETWRILAKALALVGHDTESVTSRKWVISCSKGQAVYPRIFETGAVDQPGYLMLYWAPGLLFFSGETFDRGIGPGDHPYDPVTQAKMTHPVTGPLNMVPNMKMEWKVARCDGYLEIFPTCGRNGGNAFNILANLGQSLILRRCPHNSTSPLEKPDAWATYRRPFAGDLSKSWVVGHSVDVVAVDGDAGLRMFAMSSMNTSFSDSLQIVIRSNSCLQCCLDLCRRAKRFFLIC